MTRKKSKSAFRKDGQSLVEFALAIPFIVLVLVAVMFFGRVFYVKQAIALATQEGARALSRTPNLSDASTREFISGFTVSGTQVNPQSVVSGALGAARLLSNGESGDLPPGSSVRVLPWDGGTSPEDITPQGTVAIRIEYPFRFLGDPFSSGGSTNFGDSIDVWTGEGGAPMSFANFTISEKTVALQEVYQQ